jgi:serum/glucocorticoid-regulated kinase 2
MPSHSNGLAGHAPSSRTGLLSVRVISGRGFTLPPNTPLPPAIESALLNESSNHGHHHQRSSSSNNRESLQKKRYWWLPYVVLEFDKNEIMIDALGGELGAPVWMRKVPFDVSRAGDVAVSAYLRTQPAGLGEGDKDMGNDILLGRLDLSPSLDAHHVRPHLFLSYAVIILIIYN